MDLNPHTDLPAATHAEHDESGDTTPTARPARTPRVLRRRLLGVHPEDVERELGRLGSWIDELAGLLEHERRHGTMLEAELGEERAQVRFWLERQQYVDAELTRIRDLRAGAIESCQREVNEIVNSARIQAREIVQAAESDAARIATIAQERSLTTEAQMELKIRESEARLERLEAARVALRRRMKTSFHDLAAAVEAIGDEPDLIDLPASAMTHPESTVPTTTFRPSQLRAL